MQFIYLFLSECLGCLAQGVFWLPGRGFVRTCSKSEEAERLKERTEERIDGSLRGLTTESLCLMHLPNPHPPGEREKVEGRRRIGVDVLNSLFWLKVDAQKKQRLSFTAEIKERNLLP